MTAAENSKFTIGVVGLGTMGLGIAQLAAANGCRTVVFDSLEPARVRALPTITNNLEQRVIKEKITRDEMNIILARFSVAESIDGLGECDMVIEAIVEDLEIKQQTFKAIERAVCSSAILATNTSSLSVTKIASACEKRDRILGLHFFNPATVMPLVEIVPTEWTDMGLVEVVRGLVTSWGKTAVLAKDSPGFIVNRIARPYYGESLRICEEGIADPATIDWALKTFGGFSMGPFELMDLIGNDINLAVSETVWRAFDCAPRFAPSPLQRKLVEAGQLGRKTGRGYYDYSTGATKPSPQEDTSLAEKIFMRIISMLINEAVDALDSGVATREDIDTAMMKGVNYPKGLLRWGDELGAARVVETLESLQSSTNDTRYKPHPLLKKHATEGHDFYG